AQAVTQRGDRELGRRVLDDPLDGRHLLLGRRRAAAQHERQHETARADAEPGREVLRALQRAVAPQLLHALGRGLLGALLPALVAHRPTSMTVPSASSVRDATIWGRAR